LAKNWKLGSWYRISNIQTAFRHENTTKKGAGQNRPPFAAALYGPQAGEGRSTHTGHTRAVLRASVPLAL